MGQWYVIETNVKCEDKAERNIRRAGFEVYAPIARTEIWNKRKKVHVVRELRLMPRYLFVRVEGAVPWYVIRACEGVKRALGAEGRPCQLTPREAVRLYEVMAAEQNLEFDTTRDGKLRRGEIGKNKRETTRIQFPAEAKITITKGPFATFSGEVITVTGQGKLKALISVLGRMSEVEIPSGWATVDDTAEAA